MKDSEKALLWDIIQAQNTLGHAVQQIHMHLLALPQRSEPLHKSVNLIAKHADMVSKLMDRVQEMSKKAVG